MEQENPRKEGCKGNVHPRTRHEIPKGEKR